MEKNRGLSLVKIDKIKEDWSSRGFSCGLWTDPPGTVWEDYVHGVDELILLVEGEVELEMEGRKIRLEEGREELIPARVTHSVRNKGRTRSKWLYGYKHD